MNFIEELKWRELYFDMIPSTDKFLQEGQKTGYIGFDPTSSSLGIGNLVQIMLLRFFQLAGHRPIALLGGATGMVGDPSGKSAERNLITTDEIYYNIECFKEQLSKYIDFDNGANAPLLLNNYDWYKSINILDFLRDVGKHLTVNYMIAKDSVKSRMDTGISFTEFSYQLLQAYDFYWLNQHHGCTMQMGGSDQWGNITAGVELIRRMGGDNVFAVTSPLITKSDGTKFGKTEEGNIYLDPQMTSPYKFYQFWLNVSDEEANKFIRIFTFLSKEEIEGLAEAHAKEPHLRTLQKRLAKEVTIMVHSQEDYDRAIQATEILFGRATKELLKSISEKELLEVFEGVPTFTLGKSEVESGINIMECLTEKTQVFPSKGELRRTIQQGGLSINKEKINDEAFQVSSDDLLSNRYMLVQKGKKNYYLIVAE